MGMEFIHPRLPEKSYAGSRYYREFISRIRRDEDAGRYEHLEDYPYDILVDDDLGIRLYHAGINPYDQEHFRHQIYLVVTPNGKVSKICPADSVVASALTLQWTRRGDLCNALLLSIKSFGQCTFAYSGDMSRNKCGWCGHNMRTLLWRNNAWKWVAYRPGRRLEEGERHCCSLNVTMKKYQCCKCRDPDNALMSPLDRETAAELPQSVLPVHPEGYKRLNTPVANANLFSTPPNASPKQPSRFEASSPPPVNNIHLNFYGNNHVYQSPPAGSGCLSSSAPVWSLSMSQLDDIDRRTTNLIDFSALTSAMAAGDPPTVSRVQELSDSSGPSSPKSPKPRKYASPRVEDDITEAADLRGARRRMSDLVLGI
ncbi:hypothetical protein RB594_006293 [Gaeumannomyces avenae]